MYEFLVMFFITLIAGGLVWAYFRYLNEKGERLHLINQGICPSCKNETIEMVDQKGGGCSGTAFVEFKCRSCDYSDSFNLGSGACGSGGCKV
ncbi:MAG TPA: hypothetical protein EYG95_04295 [Campylobacterales bacterium]|nr:hypothetical protein [Campylobacterales bacterium]